VIFSFSIIVVICFSLNKPVEVKIRKTGDRFDVKVSELKSKGNNIKFRPRKLV
jgi:hypothetical protein